MGYSSDSQDGDVHAKTGNFRRLKPFITLIIFLNATLFAAISARKL